MRRTICAALGAAARATNPNVTFARVPSGGHYDATIERGIPAGIAWLKARGR